LLAVWQFVRRVRPVRDLLIRGSAAQVSALLRCCGRSMGSNCGVVLLHSMRIHIQAAEVAVSHRRRATTWSTDRRWIALRTGGEHRVPLTDGAGVSEGRTGEFQRQGMGVLGRADVLPVENELAQIAIPAGGLRV
jgi:hypothetical protein